MLDPIELHVSPSCYDCLAWSADGEVALAVGEYVQILTPRKPTQKKEEIGSERSKREPEWYITRFRANLFINKEWPMTFPQNRDDFSIGPEISLSSVVGLAWSPPGLAKYRRCTLAVLTSNLILSLYQTVEGKWTRVTIVNKALLSHFGAFIHDEGPKLRKTNIRAFAWCPPLKVPQDESGTAPHLVPGAETRWGFQILAVANDDNDMIFLHVRSCAAESGIPSYAFDMLSLTSIHDPAGNYPTTHPGSILATCLKSKLRISCLSCGPWLRGKTESGADVCSAIGNVAVIYGTKLKIIRLDARLSRDGQGPETAYSWDLKATSTERQQISDKLLGENTYRGPIEWSQTAESQRICFAVSVPGALKIVSLPQAVYGGADTPSEDVQTNAYPLRGETDTVTGNEEISHWEPIGAMTVACDNASLSCTLHLGTVGGIAAAKELTGSEVHGSLSPAPWKNRLDSIRERFDIDHDLGGMAIGRVWGLAAYDGVVAAAITLHPGDMVEYRTGSQERTSIIFSKASLHQQQDIPSAFRSLPEFTADYLRSRREVVLGFILHSLDYDDRNPCYQRMVYTAACCALVDSQSEALRAQAKKVFAWLATTTGVDLTEEMTKCSTPGNTIEAKSAEQLNGPSGQIFERCDICQAGIAWYSAQEAQCASGHLFVRCNLSFLSIQEPGTSKFCSGCGKEYLSEDVVGQTHGADLQHAYERLSATFDTCVYCGGKFRA